MLVVDLDGWPVARYEVAVGSPRHPTPQGEFSIDRIIWNPSWNPPDSPWARGARPKPSFRQRSS
ncbi:MAG TPA: L,D-transpeptidase [Thermoanaerobaculia bacterium]|nr:L,D-transpeptidase [Thermoanaerobaculia bacterium]